jgi:16S rRNA (uracil1498-N3)-methyltransferase
MTYFLHDAPLQPGAAVELRGEEAHHLLRVRRIRPGERFALQDPQGRRFAVELTGLERHSAQAVVREALPVPAAPAVRVTLLQASVKDKSAELIVEKITELGVAALVFFPSEHGTVPHKALAAPKSLVRWERIAREACKQCDRQFPPAIAILASLAAALQAHPARAEAGAPGWLLHPGAERSAAEALAMAQTPARTAALQLLCGPEGGFTSTEVQAATAAGYLPVRLGATTLRAETAALAACALAVLGS